MRDHRRFARLVGCAGVAFGLAPLAAQLPPLGPQFQVNSYTTDEQFDPAVALDAEGDFVVVWNSLGSPGPDSSEASVQGQRYIDDGTPLRRQFQVNGAFSTGSQLNPRVARGGLGQFVVVWDGELGAPVPTIEARRFGANGLPLGDPFVVASSTGDLDYPDVASDGDGNFVVVWQDSTNNPTAIFARRFLADGTPLSPFLVNSYVGDSSFPAIAMSAGGSFVVVWDDLDGEPGQTSRAVRARLFAADGTPSGPQFRVDTHTLVNARASVAVADDGAFVVAWSGDFSPGTDPDGSSIQARRYAAGGVALGDQFQVNSYSTGDQDKPTVAMLPGGGFAVTWASAGSAGSDQDATSIQARRFRDDGLADGDDVQVNSYTTGAQGSPRVVASNASRLTIVWDSVGSAGTDDDLSSIQGRQLGPFFQNGFETGDLGGWEVVFPLRSPEPSR